MTQEIAVHNSLLICSNIRYNLGSFRNTKNIFIEKNKKSSVFDCPGSSLSMPMLSIVLRRCLRTISVVPITLHFSEVFHKHAFQGANPQSLTP